MSSPAAASVTPLEDWQPRMEGQPRPTGCYVCDAYLFGHDMIQNVYTHRFCRAILSTADPYSVAFPLNLSAGFKAIYDLLPQDGAHSWQGVPCQLIRLRIGLLVAGSAIPRAFRLTALLPTAPVEDVPPLLRLGAEFLTVTRASVRLFTHPTHGELIIPQ